MAIIERPLDLSIEDDDQFDFDVAVLKFNVLFSDKEQELDCRYYVRAMLVEQDQVQDRYIIRTNGTRFAYRSVPHQDKDDFIGFFPLERLRPTGDSVPVELQINFGHRGVRTRVERSADPEPRGPRLGGAGDEDLFAIVHVYSELDAATEYSGLIRADIA